MAREALRYKQYHAAVVFFELMVRKIKGTFRRGNENEIPDIFGDRKIEARHAESLLAKTVRLHDETLLQNGEIGITHRCRGKPFGENITYHDIPLDVKTHIPDIVGRSMFDYYQGKSNISEKHSNNLTVAIQLQSEKLCSGGKYQVKHLIFITITNNLLSF